MVQVSGMVSIYWVCAVGAGVCSSWAGIRDALRPPLRSRYQEGAFLQALHKALPQLYSLAPPACTPLLPLVQLHAMVTQHSLFLPTLLVAADGGGPDAGVKGEPPELFPQCWATGHPWVWSGGSDVRVGRSPERARRCSAPRILVLRVQPIPEATPPWSHAGGSLQGPIYLEPHLFRARIRTPNSAGTHGVPGFRGPRWASQWGLHVWGDQA